MMGRFCGYIDKVFRFGEFLPTLTDSRQQPVIPTHAAFVSAFGMFATGRPSLHQWEKEVRMPSRLAGMIGPHIPSVDSIGRIYAGMASAPLVEMLSAINHRLRRNKVFGDEGGLLFAAVDGHEFFSSRKRCCPQCLTRTIHLKDESVTEYYHRGVVCHLIGQELAIPIDVELLRPGEGEASAARRLLERVFVRYARFIDVVGGDALYFEAPFINFCREHHKHVIVVVKGEQRLLLQDALGVFSQQTPGEWQEGNRRVRYWDQEGFTSAEGVKEPLRVLYTEETVRRRQRIAGEWKVGEETSHWCWATTLSKNQLGTRGLYEAGHGRWDIENDCFNTLSTHWALDHCFKHEPQAIVNFVLTCFIAYVLLQSFWRGNLKPQRRKLIGTLIGLADELRRSLGPECRAPWLGRPP
jgi:hypothetical protein